MPPLDPEGSRGERACTSGPQRQRQASVSGLHQLGGQSQDLAGEGWLLFPRSVFGSGCPLCLAASPSPVAAFVPLGPCSWVSLFLSHPVQHPPSQCSHSLGCFLDLSKDPEQSVCSFLSCLSVLVRPSTQILGCPCSALTTDQVLHLSVFSSAGWH